MSEQSNDMSSIPAWLQLFLATITGVVIGVGALIKWGFSINNRLQRIENQDLDKIIETHLNKDRHDTIYPMMADRIFKPLDKIEDEQRRQGQDIAILLERDRIGQRMEKIISALNAQALKPDQT